MQNLGPEDYYKNCTYNAQTKNQLWMSQIADSHDIWCSCPTPFAHLNSSIFPPGHQDRNLTVQQILTRDFTECHSGGEGEENPGIPITTGHTENGVGLKEEEEEYIKDEDLQKLIDVGEDAGGTR